MLQYTNSGRKVNLVCAFKRSKCEIVKYRVYMSENLRHKQEILLLISISVLQKYVDREIIFIDINLNKSNTNQNCLMPK